MKRQAKRISRSLDDHLKAYALAASAAGVGALVLSQTAEAKIVYYKTNVTIGPNQTYRLDLNRTGCLSVGFRTAPGRGQRAYQFSHPQSRTALLVVVAVQAELHCTGRMSSRKAQRSVRNTSFRDFWTTIRPAWQNTWQQWCSWFLPWKVEIIAHT